MNIVKNKNNYILEWKENNKNNFIIFKNKEDIENAISNKKRKKMIFNEIAKINPEILL